MLQQGSIVWGVVPDPTRGNPKRRPIVLVSDPAQVPAGQRLIGVCVSTSIRKPLPAAHILLPFHPQGRCRTRLRRESAAVCSWVVSILPEDVQGTGGVVGAAELQQILANLSP